MSLRRHDPLTLRDSAGHPVIATLRDGGRDTGVVLVPGILGWRGLAEIGILADALAQRHDVLAIDVRGHGDDPGSFTWGLEEWRQVDAAVRALQNGGRRVGLVGFSFGGYHAALACARGAPATRLVLVGAPVDMRVWDHFPFGADFFRTVPLVWRRRRRPSRLGVRLGRRRLGPATGAAIGMPTLVVHGTCDWLVSARHARSWASWIPQATLLHIEGGLHAEYLLSAEPSRLIDPVARFLEPLATAP
jgi:pimeloyl-ACP methyl ester carboxylesterase